MSTYTSRNRRLKSVGTMVGMALAVTAVPLTASAFATADASTAVRAAVALEDSDLIAMRDEERLAGDTYTALADLTGARIFTNIARAEERHQGAVERLLTARGLDVGALGDEPGDYSVGAYEDLYAEFLARGEKGLDAALEVGVEIEQRDISDLENRLEQQPTASERQVLEALLRGSQHHLAAFTMSLEGRMPDGFGAPGRDWPGHGGGMGPRMGRGMDMGRHLDGGRGPGGGDCPRTDRES